MSNPKDEPVTLNFRGCPPIRGVGPVITEQRARPLSEIAEEITDSWAKPYFGAVPYIQAMLTLNKITDYYGAESAAEIVQYFLSNARTWRGRTAQRIKAELKGMIK